MHDVTRSDSGSLNVLSGPLLVTPCETARILGVKRRTLANWRATGRNADLPFVKIGRTVMYRAEDIHRFVEGRVVGSPVKKLA